MFFTTLRLSSRVVFKVDRLVQSSYVIKNILGSLIFRFIMYLTTLILSHIHNRFAPKRKKLNYVLSKGNLAPICHMYVALLIKLRSKLANSAATWRWQWIWMRGNHQHLIKFKLTRDTLLIPCFQVKRYHSFMFQGSYVVKVISGQICTYISSNFTNFLLSS